MCEVSPHKIQILFASMTSLVTYLQCSQAVELWTTQSCKRVCSSLLCLWTVSLWWSYSEAV